MNVHPHLEHSTRQCSVVEIISSFVIVTASQRGEQRITSQLVRQPISACRRFFSYPRRHGIYTHIIVTSRTYQTLMCFHPHTHVRENVLDTDGHHRHKMALRYFKRPLACTNCVKHITCKLFIGCDLMVVDMCN